MVGCLKTHKVVNDKFYSKLLTCSYNLKFLDISVQIFGIFYPIMTYRRPDFCYLYKHVAAMCLRWCYHILHKAWGSVNTAGFGISPPGGEVSLRRESESGRRASPTYQSPCPSPTVTYCTLVV